MPSDLVTRRLQKRKRSAEFAAQGLNAKGKPRQKSKHPDDCLCVDCLFPPTKQVRQPLVHKLSIKN